MQTIFFKTRSQNVQPSSDKMDTKTGSQTKTDMIVTRGKDRMCNHLTTRKSETRMTASVLKQDTNTHAKLRRMIFVMTQHEPFWDKLVLTLQNSI